MASCGTLEVLAAFDPALVFVSSCSMSGSTIDLDEGNVETVDIVVENDNDEDAVCDVEFTANGTVVNEALGVVIPPGGDTLTFSFGGFDFVLDPGTYNTEAVVVSGTVSAASPVRVAADGGFDARAPTDHDCGCQ